MHAQKRASKKWRQKNKSYINHYIKLWKERHPRQTKRYEEKSQLKRMLKQIEQEKKNRKKLYPILKKVEKESWIIFDKILWCVLNSKKHIRLIKRSDKLYRRETRLRNKMGLNRELI